LEQNGTWVLPPPSKSYTSAMPVLISMLRGVNLGSHNRIKMDALRGLYESLHLEEPRTYEQSGNVIFRTQFRTQEKNLAQLAKKIQSAIEKAFACRPEVILRTVDELRNAVGNSPFAKRSSLEPSKILITFLAEVPGSEAQDKLTALKNHPEELHLRGRELYIYFPDGVGKSKLPWAR
jgi:uncharacterized protein (DUF1697 family)